MPKFYLSEDDVRAYRADRWEHDQLQTVADQWEQRALQQLNEQYSPTPAPRVDESLGRLGTGFAPPEITQPFGESMTQVQRLTSQVNPSIAAPPPELEPITPSPSRPDLRSLNQTGEQYTPPPNAAVPPPSQAAPAAGTVNPNPSADEVRSYIVQAAQARGIDPNTALRVAQSEGGFEAARRGTFKTGSSWWPFQLHYGGAGYEHLGNVAGMGNRFTAETGFQPGDPNAWQAATDYALDEVKRKGWGQWYGASAQGITGFQGVNREAPTGATPGRQPVATQDPDKVAAMQSGDWESVARAQLGKPYIWGSKGGRSDFSDSAVGFDCSGFVSYVYRNGLNMNMPAYTGDIYKATQGISPDQAQPGDLVMLMNSGDGTQQHVGIYLGNGQMINSTGGGVQIEPVWRGMEFRRDPRLADRPGATLGILDTATQTAEARPNTPEEAEHAARAKAQLAPEPSSPLEQITRPFGEAFGQLGQVLGQVGGTLEPSVGAVQRIPERIQSPQTGNPLLDVPGTAASALGTVVSTAFEPFGEPSESYPSGGPLAGPLTGGLREQAGVAEQARKFEQDTGIPYARFEQLVSEDLARVANGEQAAPDPQLTQLREYWNSISGVGQKAYESYAQAPEDVQRGVEMTGALAQALASAPLALENAPLAARVAATAIDPLTGLPAVAGRAVEAAGPTVGRIARSRLPAEAEAGFAAGMPTGGRPPDIPTPPPGAAAAEAAETVTDVFGTPTGPVTTANILDSPNYQRLQRQRGTAEQAEQLRPQEEGFAANINLDKIGPDDVKTMLSQAAEENNLYAGQRRGVITDPQARQNAAAVALRMSPEDWIKTKPGRAFNQEEALALGETMVRSGNEYSAMRAALAAAEDAGTATDLMRAATAEKALELALLEGVRSGATAEAGRALRAYRSTLNGALRNKADDPRQAFKAALKAIGTDEERYAQWVKAWDALPADNVVGKYKLLQALHEPTKMQKLVAFTTNNMFSPRTLEVNLLGGAIETVNRPLIELLGGRPGDAWTDITAMGRALGQAWANGGEAFATGVRRSQAGRTLASGKYDNVRPEAFPGKLGWIFTPLLRGQAAGDEFVRTLNAAGGLAVGARREARATGTTVEEILSEPPEHVLKFAQDAADASVLEGEGTPASKLVNSWRNLIYSSDPDPTKRFGEQAAGAVGHVLFPFVNIPEQILVGGVKMLPGINEGTALYNIYKGARSGDEHRVYDALGRYMLVNSVLLAAGAEVMAGNITGNGPKDPQKRATLEAARDENGNKIWQAHSIRIGDRWFDYTNLGRAAIPFAALANAQEAYYESGKKPGANEVVDVFNRVADTMLDASYIQGFGRIMKAIGEGHAAKAGGELIGNVATRFVPEGGTLAQLARIGEQETKQPRNLAEYVGARIPGVSAAAEALGQPIPDKPSPFGGTVQQPQDVVSNISPVRVSAPGEPEPIAMAFQEVGMGAPSAPPTISVTNQATRQASPPMALNDEEKRQYMEHMGTKLRELATPTVNSPTWQQQSPENRKKSLETMTRAAREYAEVQIFQSWSAEERRQKMEEGAGAKKPEPILGVR